MKPFSTSYLILWIQLSTLCAPATPSTVPSAYSLANDVQNVTASINITASAPSKFVQLPQDLKHIGITLKTCSILPPNPFIYKIPQSSLTIRFQDYLQPLPATNVALCLLQASNEVTMHGCSDQLIGPPAFQTNSGPVSLKLSPATGEELTWHGWGETIRGLTYFVTTYGSLDMDFYVIEDGWTISGGSLLSID